MKINENRNKNRINKKNKHINFVTFCSNFILFALKVFFAISSSFLLIFVAIFFLINNKFYFDYLII